MSNNSNIKIEDIVEEQEFDLKYWFFRTLKYWYVFVIIVGLFLAAGYAYLRYQKTIYQVNASIMLLDEKRGAGDINLSMVGVGSPVMGGQSSAENAVATLQSFEMIQETLDSLNFQVSYHKKGTVKSSEVYGTPFQIKVNDNKTVLPSRLNIKFNGLDKYQVIKTANDTEQVIKECGFNETCESESFSFVATVKDSSAMAKYESKLIVIFQSIDRLTVNYINRTEIAQKEGRTRFSGSSIINLSLQGAVREKNIDFLNKLCEIYIQKQLEDKNQVAINTIQFIDEQLDAIADSLSWVEVALENYRSNKGIIDLSSKGQMALQSLSELESQKALIELNRKYYQYLSDYVNSEQDDLVISPSTTGISDPILGSLITELNALMSKKAGMSLTAAENDFIYLNLLEQIKDTKRRIKENIRNLLASSEISINQINGRLQRLKKDISILPKNERELLTIQRKFNLNNELYTFLLQKKSEAEITKAANQPSSRILNRARKVQARVTGPFPRRIYMSAAAIGFVLVMGILILKFYLSNTITDLHQIKKYDQTPILASIPHVNSEKAALVVDAPKSSFAEAFRNIRINLDFVTTDPKCKIIGVTSTISGEGKTFCAINLAHILALADKKTLLIGLDLRKPKLHSELGITKDIGLTNYLIGAATMEESMQKSKVEALDIITSGPLPPNPTELIENGRFEMLLEEAKEKYDYIIVDGPPIGLVTDYIAAAQLMHTTLFIVRMNYSKTHSIDLLTNYHDKGILKSSYIIVNDITLNSRAYEYSYSYTYGYGYSYGGYGYLGYTDDSLIQKKSWWKRIFSKSDKSA